MNLEVSTSSSNYEKYFANPLTIKKVGETFKVVAKATELISSKTENHLRLYVPEYYDKSVV
ncbi:hypothetical protein QE109_12675 [Fusibacter bizertensis]|uniref:Uncharacterized protein n=1 Tax=Fusibacter bizertensis TaxID=1488331 RepID=A0ABT6NF46_9FIRM|nr:hypothetical protein [Fusibacter bizertensis]MDH8679007.1 hypothetical protein [Fusibacter bizertensis]